MVRTVAPLFAFSGVGSFSRETTLMTKKGVTFTRTYKVPRDPRTAEQVTSRDTWKAAGDIWKASNDLFREAWKGFAGGQVFSPFNAFVGRYMSDNLGQDDFELLTLAPRSRGGVQPIDVTLFPFPKTIIMGFEVPATPIAWTKSRVIGAAIIDGDPADPVSNVIHITDDEMEVEGIILFDLEPNVTYQATGWLSWFLPNGKPAISQSFPMQAIIV